MKSKRFFPGIIIPFLALASTPTPTRSRRRRVYQLRFNTNFRLYDNDRGHQLRQFHVHGEPVMAYSKKDAIKRWVHADLKNRRRVRR